MNRKSDKRCEGPSKIEGGIDADDQETQGESKCAGVSNVNESPDLPNAASYASAIKKAEDLARLLHAGQKDKAGKPYIGHIERVSKYVKALGGNERQIIAAILHDTVEDAGATLDSLREAGFSEKVVSIVDALTRREEESYNEYLTRLVKNPYAILIKQADIQDNLDPQRLAKLPIDTQNRLKEKYAGANAILQNAQTGR
jgi:(p)ppGpp synthase/HD superfamily hydrolase